MGPRRMGVYGAQCAAVACGRTIPVFSWRTACSGLERPLFVCGRVFSRTSIVIDGEGRVGLLVEDAIGSLGRAVFPSLRTFPL